MSEIKRAALMLHGLQAADQAWLIAQLDEGQRGPLRSLLDELVALGVPRDASLLGALVNDEGSSHERLMGASAADVLRALTGQSAEVVAMLLRLHAWPWRHGVIQRWAEAFAQRPALLEPLADQAGPALKAALLDAVAMRLDLPREGLEAAPQVRASMPWWRRVWPHMLPTRSAA
jgi:hypothetical protein